MFPCKLFPAPAAQRDVTVIVAPKSVTVAPRAKKEAPAKEPQAYGEVEDISLRDVYSDAAGN